MAHSECSCAAAGIAAPVILTVTDFAKKHPWPTERALRHLIFHADKNGFNAVIRRCGSRVLIREDAFFEWLERQSHTGNARS